MSQAEGKPGTRLRGAKSHTKKSRVENREEMRSWKDIWADRTVEIHDGDRLRQLIKADGFDTGSGDYREDQWLVMVDGALGRAGVVEGNVILEIGCGAGAFLLAANSLVDCRVFGVDYSKALIDVATSNIPGGTFAVAEAIDIPFANVAFDAIFSHSVFQYFPSAAYAQDVIERCHALLKPTGALCVMDINDKVHEQDYHAVRRDKFGDPEKYDAMYKGLPHLFFDKDELSGILRKSGFRDIEFFDHAVEDYANAMFRFNVLAKK